MNANHITKILAVVDTREYMEDGDRWVAIPGSGLENECERCGRLHEVHATVELADGTTAVVGTGCMKGESMEVQAALKAGASAAKSSKVAAMRDDKANTLAWQVVALALGAWEVDAERIERTATAEDARRCGKAWNLLAETKRRLGDALWYDRASARIEKLTALLAKVETTIAAAEWKK